MENLQQIAYYQPNGKGVLGAWLLVYTWFAVAMGWILGIALVAGLGKAIQNRME